MSAERLRVLTWHVHGNYLYYLTQAPHDFYVLSKPDRSPGYAGRWGNLPWGENVHDLPCEQARRAQFDCILFQSLRHWEEDQYELLTPQQRRLPRIFLEHDPPQQHPTNTLHPVQDPDALLVHVTHFNALMWDSGVTPWQVIEHGVLIPPDVRYTGHIAQGVAAVNNLQRRGRRLGADVFAALRAQVPLALVGMDAEAAGGLGEVRNPDLPAFLSRYRFFLSPIRYTSLGLSTLEAMMIGLPVVGLATAELATVVRSGHNGYVDTNLARLIEVMRELLRDPDMAWRWGEQARRDAEARFNIRRFAADWDGLLRSVCRRQVPSGLSAAVGA